MKFRISNIFIVFRGFGLKIYHSYLRNIWSKCLANEAKSNDKDMTRPPTTAVNRTLLRRQSATKKGAERCETAKLVDPIHTAKENRAKEMISIGHKDCRKDMNE